MEAFLAILSIFAAVMMWFTVLRIPSTLRASYAEGRRQGLKEARWLVEARGISSTDMAPEGNLTLGLVRSQVCNQLVLDIQDLANESKTPWSRP